MKFNRIGKKFAILPHICTHCKAIIWLEYGEVVDAFDHIYWGCKDCRPSLGEKP